MRVLWVIVISLVLSSCGAQWHLKRAIAKDPEILNQQVVSIDTLVVTEKVAATDTFFLQQHDTIETVKERVKIKVMRSSDTIRVEVECPPDTVRVVKEIPVDQLIYVNKNKGWKGKLPWQIAAIGMFLLIFIRAIKS